jgi:hypothetical protein
MSAGRRRGPSIAASLGLLDRDVRELLREGRVDDLVPPVMTPPKVTLNALSSTTNGASNWE